MMTKNMIPASTAASAQEARRIFHFYKVIIKILVPSISLPLRLGGAVFGGVPEFFRIENSQRNLETIQPMARLFQAPC